MTTETQPVGRPVYDCEYGNGGCPVRTTHPSRICNYHAKRGQFSETTLAPHGTTACSWAVGR